MINKKHQPSLYNTLRLKGYTHAQALTYMDCADKHCAPECSEARQIMSELDGGVTQPKGTH